MFTLFLHVQQHIHIYLMPPKKIIKNMHMHTVEPAKPTTHLTVYFSINIFSKKI